ncbi:MAG: hypothetical protein HGA97_05785 [Chlorobiaceae bacterium]|jgi:hypothetical protein|nr:hypothetical protein [Chlorobiaceae bacterium]
MNQRTVAGILAGLSIALIVAELLVAVIGDFNPGVMLFSLSLYAGLTGLLFALRILADGGREVVESVSERRSRAKRDGGMGALLDAYDVDEEFLGHGRRVGKPVSSGFSASPDLSAKDTSPRGDAEMEAGAELDAASPLSLSIDKESFDDYIRRCMSEPGTCIDEEESEPGYSVDLDAEELSGMPGTPPTNFSHDPKAVMSRLNRPGEKR